MNLAVSKSMCVNPEDELHIGGKQGHKSSSTTIISVEHCNKVTSKELGIQCVKPDKITDFFSELSMQIIT